MGKLSGSLAALTAAALLVLGGCGGSAAPAGDTGVELTDESSPEELYERALAEDMLVVYTVSTRVVDTKEAFEKAYPGLFVEVRDLRRPNLIEEVERGSGKGRNLKACKSIHCRRKR